MSGAGKSTVCEVFRERGFSVIDCDGISRKTAGNAAFLKELSERFSKALLKSDGSLDREAVAALIYSDEQAKSRYQRVIFPYIIYGIIRQIKGNGGVCVLDAPTLFESGLEIICSKIVSVTANTDECIARIQNRDGITLKQAEKRLFSQHSAEFFRENSDYCIENNGTAADLRAIAAKIADKIKGEIWK